MPPSRRCWPCALLAGNLVDIEVVSATPDFVYRPLAVAEPFGLGTAHRFDLSHIVREQGATLHVAGVDMVEPEEHRFVTWDGRSFDYDLLLVAVGAHATTAVPGSVSIQGPAYTSRFRTVLRKLDKHRVTRVAFAVPAGASWPLPLYELALLTAAHVAERGLRKVHLQLVTHESEPLELFGPKASAAVRELLEERNVELLTSRVPLEAHRGELLTAPGPAIEADSVVSLPGLAGPALRGLPFDHDGFVPVDLHGRVHGLEDVYAAGDSTTCPIKQGGVAAQQADAVAEAIAARAGADVDPRPFRPVLRGLLLTGGVAALPQVGGCGRARRRLAGVGGGAVVAAEQGGRALPRALPREPRRGHGHPSARPRRGGARGLRRRRRRGAGRPRRIRLARRAVSAVLRRSRRRA